MANGDYPEFLLARGDAGRLPFADQSVSLIFGSPPYVDARLYLEDGKDLGIARNCLDWVEWMLRVTTECLRVSRGPVVWVAAGVTRDRNYWPPCEGLIWEWYKRGGSEYRPCYWHRNGIPGSGGDQWFRADVEYVMCFKRPGPLAWADNTTMGNPPKWAPGGGMSYRDSAGKRRNQWGGTESSNGHRKADGTTDNYVRPSHVFTEAKGHRTGKRAHPKTSANGQKDEQFYTPPTLANPGTLVRTTVGGGQLGSALAHENEAPFPEDLVEHFIRSLCPPGGTVLDPFSGSATTIATALKHGRRGIGLDLRQSQCDLGKRRVADSLRPVSKLDGAKQKALAKGQASFLDVETEDP